MEGLFPVLAVQIGIILLSAMTQASLQCATGAMLLLYHESLGKHVKKTTKRLASNYILGVVFMNCLLVASMAFGVLTIANGPLSIDFLAIIAAIMTLVSVMIWFFYYRSGQSTQLWLPKSVTRLINQRAKKTDSKVEAFSLGILTTLAEMPFSFVLVLAAANSILRLPLLLQCAGILFYAAIAILPLSMLRFFIRHGRTVVDIQKWRVKNKDFMKLASGILLLTLAIFIVAYEIVGV